MGKKLTLDEFIDKATIKHNNKYDYSNVIYEHSNIKINIICSIHGSFQQKPKKHLFGDGCKKCGTDIIKNKTKLSLDIFIKRSNEIHNNKYDYSNINFYTNAHTKVNINCLIHGIFEQTPANHLKGKNCSKCKNVYKMNTYEFIEKSIQLYGDKFDYSDVKYIKMKSHINIICKEHGKFQQTPDAFFTWI